MTAMRALSTLSEVDESRRKMRDTVGSGTQARFDLGFGELRIYSFRLAYGGGVGIRVFKTKVDITTTSTAETEAM